MWPILMFAALSASPPNDHFSALTSNFYIYRASSGDDALVVWVDRRGDCGGYPCHPGPPYIVPGRVETHGRFPMVIRLTGGSVQVEKSALNWKGGYVTVDLDGEKYETFCRGYEEP